MQSYQLNFKKFLKSLKIAAKRKNNGDTTAIEYWKSFPTDRWANQKLNPISKTLLKAQETDLHLAKRGIA